MINPLHIDLPPLVVLSMPTCNKFDHTDVQSQWAKVDDLYNEHIKPVLDGGLIGRSSDGDSRRRKLMHYQAQSNDGERHRLVDYERGFLYSVVKIPDPDDQQKYDIKGLFDQDAIHVIKKLLNPLDHATRILYMGPNYMAHMTHLKLVTELFNKARHGPTKNDSERKDRQNFESVQRICFDCVQSYLDAIINGGDACHGRPPDESVKGTKEYLLLIATYLDVKASLAINFTGIWRNFVMRTNGLTLKANFLTKECYIDCLLSCHASTILISFLRDNYPDVECRLDRIGSDCVEDFWSMNGSWVVNKHTYSYADMFQNLGSMQLLEEIRATPNGPVFNKSHKKQEIICHKQQINHDKQNADFLAYPSAQQSKGSMEGRQTPSSY